jgi:hypothetical protein
VFLKNTRVMDTVNISRGIVEDQECWDLLDNEVKR